MRLRPLMRPDRLAPSVRDPDDRPRDPRSAKPLDAGGRQVGLDELDQGLGRDGVRGEQRFGHPIVATPGEKAKGAAAIG
jgi:hypothetical protein